MMKHINTLSIKSLLSTYGQLESVSYFPENLNHKVDTLFCHPICSINHVIQKR